MSLDHLSVSPHSLISPPEHFGTALRCRSASGKSHMMMSLAVSAQTAAWPGSSIILLSEGQLPTDRLREMAQVHAVDEKAMRRMTGNIMSRRIQDAEALDHLLGWPLPRALESMRKHRYSPVAGELAPTGLADGDGVADSSRSEEGNSKLPVRLLMIDSITALFRGDMLSTHKGLLERSRLLTSITDKLKALAVEYRLAVVVINQVSDVFYRPSVPIAPPSSFVASQSSLPSQWFSDDAEPPPMAYAAQSRWFSGQSRTVGKEASLGIVWANGINTRVMLSRTGRRRRFVMDETGMRGVKRKRKDEDERQTNGPEEEGEMLLVRKAHLVFSPFAPPATVNFVVTTTGPHSLPGTYHRLDEAATNGANGGEHEASTPEPTTMIDGISGEVFEGLEQIPPDFWENESELDQDGAETRHDVVGEMT